MSAPSGSALRAVPSRWVLRRPPDRAAAEAMAQRLGLPLALGALLVLRDPGADDEKARHFLRPRIEDLPDPARIRDLARAVERLSDAIALGEPIFVHGDYDVDGVCATALLTRWIRRLGGAAHPFAPHRVRDGYDVTLAAVARAREAGAGVLLTADCGIVAHDAVAAANEAGLDVVVTDHHTPAATLPPALAVVNPNRSDDDSGYGGLCGTGVAFALVTSLTERAGIERTELLSDLDLVALATIADLVPLEGCNRALVRFGLRALGRTGKTGLRALLETCDLIDPELPAGENPPIEPGRVSFVLAPRINAAGRVGEAADALRLLLTEDRDEAHRLARHLDELNRARREEDRRTLDEALSQLEEVYDPERDHGVVLAGEGWHPGVIGIVASRVVERIHRPVILVALEGERGRGSARSIPGFHLHDAIATLADRLLRFGGHAQAAGLEIERTRLSELREGFDAVARERLQGRDLRPLRRIDLELDPTSATLEFADRARWLGPHGIGNPRPIFLSRGVRVHEAREVRGGHLKLRAEVREGYLDGIGFGLAERFPPAELAGRRVDLLYHLTVNEWRGVRTPQMKLLDLRPAGEELEREA